MLTCYKNTSDEVICLEKMLSLAQLAQISSDELTKLFDSIENINPVNVFMLTEKHKKMRANADWVGLEKSLLQALSFSDIELNSKSRFAFELANIYIRKYGEYNKALLILDENNPYHSDFCPLDLYFEIYFNQKKWEESLDTLSSIEKVLQDEEDLSFLFFRRGLVFEKMKKYTKAVSCYLKSIEYNSQFIDAYESDSSLS